LTTTRQAVTRQAVRRCISEIAIISSPVHQHAGTPDHPIVIGPAGGRIRIVFAGRVVADSDDALMLTEAGYGPVFYLPPQHVDFALLERSSHATRCPYKGEAAYYSIRVEGRTAENAAWCYERPLESVSAIAGRLAFYPDRVDSMEKLSE
jgi:uncharacterized protein (DUF427 family)